MKKVTLIIFLAMLSLNSTYGQEQLSLRQRADKLFERYEYYKSLSLYLELTNKKNVPTQVLERIAACYRNMNDYTNAERWYAMLADDLKAEEIDHYYYAETLLRNQKYTEARQQYKLYYTNNQAALKLKLFSCDSAQAWVHQSSNYQVKNVSAINTEFSDWGASLAGNGSLIFVSDRVIESKSIDDRTGNNWFEIYETTDQKNIERLFFGKGSTGSYVNQYNIGPIALNKTKDTAYVTVTTDIPKGKLTLDKDQPKTSQRLYTRRLQLMLVVKRNNQWVLMGNFTYNNVQRYSVGNAALSSDGWVIYFSSDMPGGLGKTDIWYCEKLADGNWGKPVNCGENINTAEEDNFPFIRGDSVLYYSSKGLPGMGGYDIYKAIGNRTTWDMPQNLRYPINTSSDDFYLVTGDGLSGYLSSNRQGGKGSDDIYAFTYTPPAIPTPTMVTTVPQLQAVPIIPAAKTDNFVIKTIYYDLNRWNIRPDAAAELDNLALILKRHPLYTVQLSSYTDSRASYNYNLQLSKKRERAAVTYLVSKGIATMRLTGNGYGKSHFVNQCADGVKCAEADHQLNRRTEFKLIGISETSN